MKSAMKTTAPFRIDVHQHLVTDIFRKLLKSVGITGGAGEELAEWGEESTLEMMDRQGIERSMLSYTISGMRIEDPAFFRRLARESNEALAELTRKYPGRFGGFALLPLPDVDASLSEIEYALDELKLDGVGMHSNMGGIYPGDKRFDAVFEELNRRQAVIHLHPTDTPKIDCQHPKWPPYLVEFMFETTRAVINLVYSGTMERCPDLSIILSHAGAAVPAISWRLMTAEFSIPELKDLAPKGVFAYLKRFYFDTAMACNPMSLAPIKELIDTSKILFGTDYPYMPEMAIDAYRADLNEYSGFSELEKSGIARKNALKLLPGVSR